MSLGRREQWGGLLVLAFNQTSGQKLFIIYIKNIQHFSNGVKSPPQFRHKSAVAVSRQLGNMDRFLSGNPTYFLNVSLLKCILFVFCCMNSCRETSAAFPVRTLNSSTSRTRPALWFSTPGTSAMSWTFQVSPNSKVLKVLFLSICAK